MDSAEAIIILFSTEIKDKCNPDFTEQRGQWKSSFQQKKTAEKGQQKKLHHGSGVNFEDNSESCERQKVNCHHQNEYYRPNPFPASSFDR